MSVIENTTTASKSAALSRGFEEGGMPLGRSRDEIEEPSLALMDLVSQGVIVLDTDGRVLSCNDRFATMIGVPLFVLLDLPLDQYFSQRQALAFRSLQVEDEKGGRSGEFTLRDVDNASVPVRISVSSFVGYGRGRCVAAVVTDLRVERASREKVAALAERLAYETQQRRAAQERLRRALQSGGMASWECDLGSGRAVHAVGIGRVLFCTSPRTWSRQAMIDAFVPSDREAIADALSAAEVSGSIDIEARVAGPDAAPRWIRLQGWIRADAGSTLAGFLTDVTSLRDGQDRVRPAAAREAVGEMAAAIAPESNALLHVVGSDPALPARHAAGDAHIERSSGTAHQALLRAAQRSHLLLASLRR